MIHLDPRYQLALFSHFHQRDPNYIIYYYHIKGKIKAEKKNWRILNWRTASPLSENEHEKGTILFAHFYELLSLHEIYCLSFQALIKLPSTIAIATHNHRMIFSDFSQFQSQFLHTHTHTKVYLFYFLIIFFNINWFSFSFHFLFHVAVQASYGVVWFLSLFLL